MQHELDAKYSLEVAGPAARSIANRLAEAVAVAVVEFIRGPLLINPQRVGAALRGDLSGLYAARMGTYRVLYSIDEDREIVRVRDVNHRSEVYRPR